MLNRDTLEPVVRNLRDSFELMYKAIEDEFEGAPYGLTKLKDNEFLALITARRQDPNWVRWMCLPATRNAKKTIKRWERLAMRPWLTWDEWRILAMMPEIGPDEETRLSEYTEELSENSGQLR